MTTRTLSIKIIIFLLGLFSTACRADFSINSAQWPEELPSSYYGAGQAETFKSALYGRGDLSEDELAQVAKLIPVKQTNRFYVRAGMNLTTLKLDSIKNKTETGALTGLTLLDKSKTKDGMGFEVAGGYTWKLFRGDIEYLYNKKIKHNPSPIFTTGAGTLTSNIQGHVLLANVYYDFKDVYIFKPYVGTGLGVGVNTAKTTLSNVLGADATSKSKQTLGLAWNLTAGARVGFKERFFTYAGYRLTSLGTVNWTDNANLLKLKSKFILNGFLLGIIYLI